MLYDGLWRMNPVPPDLTSSVSASHLTSLLHYVAAMVINVM